MNISVAALLICLPLLLFPATVASISQAAESPAAKDLYLSVRGSPHVKLTRWQILFLIMDAAVVVVVLVLCILCWLGVFDHAPAELDQAVRERLPTEAFGTPDEMQEECVICIELFQMGDHLIIFPSCGHVFHKECADPWLDSNNTCPTCRRVITLDTSQVV